MTRDAAEQTRPSAAQIRARTAPRAAAIDANAAAGEDAARQGRRPEVPQGHDWRPATPGQIRRLADAYKALCAATDELQALEAERAEARGEDGVDEVGRDDAALEAARKAAADAAAAHDAIVREIIGDGQHLGWRVDLAGGGVIVRRP